MGRSSHSGCILEIFTFVFMGGSIERITFVPLTKQGGPSGAGALELSASEDRQSHYQREELIKDFVAFDASKAQCANPEDRERLLGIVETACGSLDAFSRIVRDTFSVEAQSSFNAYAAGGKARATARV